MACSCSKIGRRGRAKVGRKRRKTTNTMLNGKTGIVKLVTVGAAGLAGMAAGSFVSRVPLLASNPLVSAVAEVIAAGYLAKSGKSDFVKGIAGGLAIHAVYSAATQFGGPQVKNILAISGIGSPQASLMPGSNLMPGVAGPMQKVHVSY